MRLLIRPTHSVGVLAGLTIAAITLSVGFLLWHLRNEELQHARFETASVARMLVDQIDHQLQSTDQLLTGVRERLSTGYGKQVTRDGTAVQLLLASRLGGGRLLESLCLVDAQGRVVNASGDIAGFVGCSGIDKAIGIAARQRTDSLLFGQPQRAGGDGRWHLPVARAMRSQEGNLEGAVVAILDLTQIGQSLGKVSVDYPRPAAIYLSDGTLLAATPHRDEAVGRVAPEFTTLRLPPRGAAFGVVADISSDQTRQMLTVAPIGDFPVLLGVTDDEAYSLASWRGIALPITAGTLLLVAFTGVVAAVLVQKLRRKEALAAALSLANDRYQHTVDTVMDAIIAVDESMTILLFNPAAQEMFGVKASDMIGQPLERLIPQRLRDVHRKHMADFGVTGMHSRSMAAQSQITGLRSDGQEFPIEATISQSRIEGKIQMTAVLRDVTLHRKAEGELRAANRQLRILSASLQDVREQERTRIARELHDELGQQLTGLKLSLSWLGIRLKEGRSANPDSVDDMRRLLDQAITSVRRISTDLRPPILDDLGFAEAVTWQSQEFARRSGIRISLSLDAHNHVQDPEMATALFRIVQESLTNAVRHSGAQNVNVELTEDDGALVLTIQDDGGGIRAHGTPAGIGLISMRERATSIGGQFEIISGPELGTTIQVRIALIEVAQEGMYA